MMTYFIKLVAVLFLSLHNEVSVVADGDKAVAQPVVCKPPIPVTTATIVIDADVPSMTTSEQEQFIMLLSEHLRISASALRVLPLGKRQVHDSMALAWGAGNAAVLRHSNGTLVEWSVGCGEVQAAHIPVLQMLERSSIDGSLAKHVGNLDVICWHVTNIKVTATARARRHAHASRRVRRQKIVGKGGKNHWDTNNDFTYYSGDDNGPQEGNSPARDKITPQSFSLALTTSRIQLATPAGLENNPPLVRNFVKLLTVRVGELLNYTLPDDTFYDVEDGYTRRLRLNLVDDNGLPLPSAFWLKFLQATGILLALPLEQQIGRHSFLLQATDSQGQMGVERVRLRVLPSRRAFAERKPTYESTVRLDADFSAFLLDIEQPISILQSISVKLYGNANASTLMMTQPLREGSVILSWANTTIPTDICDSAAVRSLHSKLVMADGTTLTREFVAALAPFRILSYSSLVQGPCATDKTLVSQLTTNLANNIPPPPVNNHPVLTRPLGTIDLTVGRVLNLSIPANTFHDHENGDTRHLRLVFLSDQPVTGDHWVRLDERTQTLYGLPVHAGRFEFTLVANDAGDLTARDTIIFNVAEQQTLVNHEFQLQLEHFAPTTPTDNLSRTLDIIQHIASLYGDVDAGKITVTRLTVTANITTLVWTNHSVPVPTDKCPVKLLSHLMSFLFGPKDSIAEELKNEFEPHYIRLISADPLGPCNNRGVQPEAPPTSNPGDPAIPALHNEDNSNSEASQSAESAMMTAAVPLAIIVVVVVIVVFVACFVYARSKRKGKLVVQRKTGQKPLAKPGVPVVFVDEICERPESPTKPLLLEREQPPLSPPPQYGQSRESRAGGSSNNGTLHSERHALLEDSDHVPENKQR